MEEINKKELGFEELKREVNQQNWIVPVNNVDPRHNPVGFEYFNGVVERLYRIAYESGRPKFMNKLSTQLIKIHQLGYDSIENFLNKPEVEEFRKDPEWAEIFSIVKPLYELDNKFKEKHPEYGFFRTVYEHREWKKNHIGWKAPD